MKLMVRSFFLSGIVSPISDPFGRGVYSYIRNTAQLACGHFTGEWKSQLFPPSDKEKGRPAIRWARITLLGHAIILVASIHFKLWLLPLVVSFGTCYGGGLMLLLNNAQHIGLRDNVRDFRLCCRTITLNPVLEFLYWRMNYHTEHHMYAAIPCYRLARVHELIKQDLPKCSQGVINTWLEIHAILKKQKADPSFQYSNPLPELSPADAR